MPTIWDISELRLLQPIGRRHGVVFTLHGGVAFRFALRLNRESGELDNSPIGLFDLVPFTADIDLVHSGPPEKTGPLLNDILTEVPSAECFRWELRSESEDQVFEDALMRGDVVPARLLKLSDDPTIGLIDPAKGYEDIRNKRFYYYRNPLFHLSPFAKSGRDLEVFSALLYLQTCFEAGLFEPDLTQAGWSNAEAVFKVSTDWRTRQQFERHAYLRSRLRYLLVNAVAAHRSREGFRSVAKQIGLQNFVRWVAGVGNPVQLDSTFFQFLTGDQEPHPFVLVSSARLGSDTMRLPLTTGDWLAPHAPASLPSVWPDQEIVLVSPELNVGIGTSPSSQTAQLGPLFAGTSPSNLTQEFIYFELPSNTVLSLSIPKEDENLSGFVMTRLSEKTTWTSWALPCVVERRSHDAFPTEVTMAIRLNCLGLFDAIAFNTPLSVRVGIIIWTGGGA